jgi:ribonuclease HIII
MTKDEKIAHLEAEIKKAQEEENETYLNYLQRIRKLTINVYDGGTVIFQTGTPKPPPPYGGG